VFTAEREGGKKCHPRGPNIALRRKEGNRSFFGEGLSEQGKGVNTWERR